MFHITSFYRFTDLSDYLTMQEPLRSVCRGSDVKGTILPASEGINGTIAGPREGVDAVLPYLKSDGGLTELEAKRSMQPPKSNSL